MGWLVALGVVVLVAGGWFACSSWRKRSDAARELSATVDTHYAEHDAATAAHQAAQQSASEVLRASSPDLRRRVDELRARGRSGK